MKIGVDVGTTFTKAALFGSANDVVARRAAPTPLAQRGAGRFECDVDQLADTVLGLLTDLAAPGVDLIALTWLGRGDASIDEWQELRSEAARARNERIAAYLLGLPLLPEHLQEGLSQFGRSCED